MRVLVIEDDPRITKTIGSALDLAGFITGHEKDREDGWHTGSYEAFDAIILDLDLPTLDGLTILQRWRKADLKTPVLFLTARASNLAHALKTHLTILQAEAAKLHRERYE